MEYKLLALDLDGTLLNSKEEISKKNLEAIKRVNKKGVKIIVTTGRSYASAESYITKININDPVITYNGAVIHDFENVIRKITLKDNLIKDILKLLKDMDYAPIIYDENHKYYETFGGYTHDFLEFSKTFERELIKVENIIDREWKNVIRLSVVTGEPDIPLLHSELKKNFGEKIKTLDTYFVGWNFWIFEILSKDCSKSNGLSFLCNTYNIEQEEVIAVGDNNNDLDMITWAGMGVAMKNGLTSVIKEADYVTERNNDEDGVTEVLEKFIL